MSDEVTYHVQTARQPGAVAIIQIYGERAAEVERVLAQLTGRANWPVGLLGLVDFAGIDTGLAGRVTPCSAQLMPHGGLRVLQRIEAWLVAHGVEPARDADPRAAYPEAADDFEAGVLHAIACAASPAAIDRLARQPALWAAARARGGEPTVDSAEQAVLNRLIDPPTVVVVGRPNAGKSTLLNRLTGRGSALVSETPGTTRDWVGALVELTPAGGEPRRDAVAVRWLDTPGLRGAAQGAGQVEQRAIAGARQLISDADVLIALRSPEVDGPDAAALPREPDLRVVNKCDLGGDVGLVGGGEIAISARDDIGIDGLIQAVLDRLGVLDLPDDALWDVGA